MNKLSGYCPEKAKNCAQNRENTTFLDNFNDYVAKNVKIGARGIAQWMLKNKAIADNYCVNSDIVI